MTWRDIFLIAFAIAFFVLPCVAIAGLGAWLKRRLTRSSPQSELVRPLRASEIVAGLSFAACMTASLAIIRLTPVAGGEHQTLSMVALVELTLVWFVFCAIFVLASLVERAFHRKQKDRNRSR